MTYDLYLGDRTYSSWSLRGWLLFERFGIETRTHYVTFGDSHSVAEQLADIAPARTVPALKMADGTIVSESIAIAEELASRHPDAGLWPDGPAARAWARNLTAEMHAGFSDLREHCPMNLRLAYVDVPQHEGVEKDLRRLETIWADCRAACEPSGPWLAGDYSIVDAFYAPIAGRIAGYGLPVSAEAQAYVAAHLADPAFRRWRAMGFAEGAVLNRYKKPYNLGTWPGPAQLAAKAIDSGEAENATCPYSGKPVTHLAEIEGRVFGFCNAFCRDKTVADPAAWPKFMAIYES